MADDRVGKNGDNNKTTSEHQKDCSCIGNESIGADAEILCKCYANPMQSGKIYHMREDIAYSGFHLGCTSGLDPNNGNMIYRVHVVHDDGPEAGVFNIMVFFTEEYVEFNLRGQDPHPLIKDAAVNEAKRRIDEHDYENGQTYQKMFTSRSR